MTPDNELNICYVDESETIGGAEIYLRMLLDHFKTKYQINLIHTGDEAHRNYYPLTDLQQVYFSAKSSSGIAKIKKYRRLFRQINPDVLHVNQPAPDRCLQAIIAGHLASVKRIVVTCHLPSLLFSRSWLGRVVGKVIYDRVMSRIVWGLPDKVIVVSESGMEDLRKNYHVCDPKSVCIHNGVDHKKFRNLPDAGVQAVRERFAIPKGHLLLTSVGRLHTQKGFDLLIRAFSQVRKRCPNTELLIVGEGGLRGELAGLAADLKVEEATHLVGHREDIPEILAASDLYVNSSLYEGLPFTILEAMAAGLPVIASKVDGNKDVLKNGLGLLVPQGDLEEMVAAIVSLIEHEKDRLELGSIGMEHVKKHYSLEGMMAETEKVYLG